MDEKIQFGVFPKKAEECRFIKAEVNDLSDNPMYKGVFEAISADCSLDKLREDLSAAQMSIPTGVGFLDEIMCGGVYNGLTIFCGSPNIGKTTLLIQMSVSLSKRGQPVVYLTNDMSRTEVLLKAVCCTCTMFTAKDINIAVLTSLLTSGDSIDEQIFEVYNKACQNLSIVDISLGANEKLEALCNDKYDTEHSDATHRIYVLMDLYSKLYKTPPIFIIDSLQSVALANGAGKEGVDVTLGVIKQLQRRFNTPVVLVSNLSRGCYNGEVKIEYLKESGNIEYEASCIIGLSIGSHYVNLQDFRSDRVRSVNIANLKHRIGGFKNVDIDFDVERCMFWNTAKDQLTSTSADKSADDAKSASAEKTSKPKHKKSTAGSAKGKNGVDENLLRKSNSIAAFLANCDAKKS